MDAKRMGTFIAERRKELGLTQALLAEQLHVTDKAISRWERGIGFPDLGNIEALADALDVSLIELIQAQRNGSEKENMSTKEAEQLLIDTIQLSKAPDRFAENIGRAVLAIFAILAAMVLYMLVSDYETVIFSVGSIITGLIAWGIPVWQTAIAKTRRTAVSTGLSLGAALLSLMIQFLDIANEVHTGDMAAVEDTIDGLVVVVFVFIAVTLVLNAGMAAFSKYRE
ncbi:MAG: helix-turn-helix domain-containing protein [Clostridiales bacterium]|nr:helix-turn-helix domain-containing protein [Clostridiales bacterium]